MGRTIIQITAPICGVFIICHALCYVLLMHHPILQLSKLRLRH